MYAPEALLSHAGPAHPSGSLTFSSLIGALSFALDLTEGAQPGHALRTCFIGMRIAEQMRLPHPVRSDLYYALLLKDAGCSSNATRLHQIVGGDERRAKAFTKTADWTRFDWKQVQYILTEIYPKSALPRRLRAIGALLKNTTKNAEMLIRLRCFQGAGVVKDLGLGEGTADAIYNLDEHWDGSGYPDHLAGHAIPLTARILSLAQTVEVFHQQFGSAAALDCMQRRSGRWFDPDVVRAAVSLLREDRLWPSADLEHLKRYVASMEPSSRTLPADDATIDRICLAFAGVIDAKSQNTYRHSVEVARVALGIGEVLGVEPEEATILRRAALLHDIGKLSVPNSILDKPGKLDAAEWNCVKEHPRYTYEVLKRIPTFEAITTVAAGHHEKLDGSGYHLGLRGAEIPRLTRILTLADIFEALTGERPYHRRLDWGGALQVMRKDVPHALDPECFAALEYLAHNNAADAA